MVNSNPMPTVHTLKGTEIILGNLGTKMNHGQDLNSPERIMAISAAAVENGNQYGPAPGSFELRQPELPEIAKGALADYAS